MFGDIFVCHTGEGGCTSIGQAEASNAAKHPPVHRAVPHTPTKKYLAYEPCCEPPKFWGQRGQGDYFLSTYLAYSFAVYHF